MNEGNKGLKHSIRAMSATFDGLRTCFKREASFRQECSFGVVNLVLAVVVPKTWIETIVLVAAYLVLPMVELVNSAIEEAVDLAVMTWDERAKRAKDYGSAAVFLAIVLICVSWAVVLYRRFS